MFWPIKNKVGIENLKFSHLKGDKTETQIEKIRIKLEHLHLIFCIFELFLFVYSAMVANYCSPLNPSITFQRKAEIKIDF